MNACLRVEADLLTSKFLFFVFFQATNLSRTMKRCLIKIENCKFTKANLSINFLHLHTQLDSSSWELIAQTVIVALSSRSRLSARVSVENTLKECGMMCISTPIIMVYGDSSVGVERTAMCTWLGEVSAGEKILLIAKNFNFPREYLPKRPFAKTLKLPAMHFLVET